MMDYEVFVLLMLNKHSVYRCTVLLASLSTFSLVFGLVSVHTAYSTNNNWVPTCPNKVDYPRQRTLVCLRRTKEFWCESDFKPTHLRLS